MNLSLITGIIIGILFLAFILTIGKNIYEGFRNKALLIQKYWIVVIIFIAVSIIAYALTLNMVNKANIELAISILNQTTGLIFAIFVGYFAFVQVMEGRKDKFDELALAAWRATPHPQYSDARKYFEHAHAISPKDYGSLANLCEIYLTLNEFDDLEKKLKYLKKYAIKEKQVVYHYLYTGMQIMKGHLNEANDSIKQTVDFINQNPSYINTYRWFFSDLQKSPNYKALAGDKKKLFENFIKFLEQNMTTEEKAKYLAGDHLL